jgi:hypothetical protein
MSKKDHEEEYERKLLDSSEWINRADALLEGATLMEPRIIQFWETWSQHKKDRTLPVMSNRFMGIYFMLVSFAMENLFKALIIKKEGEQLRKELRDKRRFPKKMKTHNLVDLAKQVAFPIECTPEEHLLRRLSRRSEWAGRYPVPLDEKRLFSEVHSDGYEYLSTEYWPSDLQLVRAMIKKIRQFAEVKS